MALERPLLAIIHSEVPLELLIFVLGITSQLNLLHLDVLGLIYLS